MNASLTSIINPIKSFFGKYHSTFFFTVIVLLLAGAILSMYLTIQSGSTISTEPPAVISSSFDQKTADEIQKLRESSEAAANLTLPTPRSNPFVE